MPKKIEYPRASFKACLNLASAIGSLGGNCEMSMCAAKMGKKMGGGFQDLTSAAAKFGLITRKKGVLYLSDTYNKMNLSYTEDEKKGFLRDFFLGVPVFKEIYSKYREVKLPVDILDKALVKEFDVDRKLSKRVSKYFIEGAKEIGLLNSDNSFNETDIVDLNIVDRSEGKKTLIKNSKLITEEDYSGLDTFVVHISGKGMNSKIEINEIEDLSIVDAMINKIKKNLENLDS